MISQNRIIKQFMNGMFEYQKEHNIVQECIVHTTILYDFLTHNFGECNIIIGFVSDNYYQIASHCWVEYKNKILDPSYEFYYAVNYYKHIVDLDNKLLKNNKNNMKMLLNAHIKLSNTMKIVTNNTKAHPGGKNNKYTNELHDYLDKIHFK